MDIENVAVSTLSLAISKSGYLVSHINSSDTRISWDGEIEVYKKAGSTHSNRGSVIKILIQVKGKISNHLKKSAFSCPVRISDMKNYLLAGGTIYSESPVTQPCRSRACTGEYMDIGRASLYE